MTDRELLMYALGEMKHFCVLDRAVRKIEAALASERAKQEEPVPFNAPGKAHVEAMLGSAALPAVQGYYVQPVPEHCDRITWRGKYFHLPLHPSPADDEAVKLLRQAKAWIDHEPLVNEIIAYLARVKK